jgi:putative CocE/NonD family hydrolase
MLKQLGLICLLTINISLSAQERPYVLLEDVRIPMRDGTTLAGYISHPVKLEKAPVLLQLNSYPRPNDIQATQHIFELSSRAGYAFAEFYIRGKGNSEGEIAPFETDGDDAYDIIDWLSRQPWSNGEVGMCGGSYLGFTQWAALKKPHPALKTIVPMVAVAPGIDFPMANGVFMTYMLRWLNYTTNSNFTDDELFDDEEHWKSLSRSYYLNGTAFNKYDSLDKNPKKIFQRWINHPTYDEYWSSFIPTTKEQYSKIQIPILTMTGYFDDDQRGAFHYYNLHNRYGNPDAVKDHILFIGPYDHYTAQGQRHYATHQNHSFDSSAYVNKMFMNIQWFNHIFKGGPRPALLKDRVNYYLIGVGWQHGPSLKAIAPDTLSQYLHAAAKVHGLKQAAPTKSRDELTFNFHSRLFADDTIPTFRNGDAYLDRENQFIFDSAPLEKDFDLIGSPVADLYLRLSGIKDADIKIVFYEVTKDGTNLILSEVEQRLSHATDERNRILLKQNKVHHIHIDDTFFMAKRIAKGSTIRFVVHILNSPAHQKNYGSGKDVSKETKSDITSGKLWIVIDKDHQSAIHLPGKQG